MPVLFVGHGSPLNAIEDNTWSRAMRGLAALVPRPRAILCISAHWLTQGTQATANQSPRTIHDFGGFPDALFQVEYAAPGDPELAQRAVSLIGTDPHLSLDWGLDHGSWAVLRLLYPEANIPVVQLGLDVSRNPAQMVEAGAALAPLRAEGVLILASGNITHNLGHAVTQRGSSAPQTPSWAETVDGGTRDCIESRDLDGLLNIWPHTEAGRMAHPHPDHWFPLLYAYGASDGADTASFPIEGFSLGSLSMRTVLFG